MKLYRPVGQKEYELIEQSRYKKFPPRLDWQPIFYPVLSKEYAQQIAKEWNTQDEFSGYLGYVLEFEVKDKFLAKYEVHTVGGNIHQEYWIPAADLEELNKNLITRKFGLAITPIDKYVNDRLLNPELKDTFFLSKVQLRGSGYHEFKPGKWENEHWAKESIYLRDDDIYIFALFFSKTLKKYDPYFMQEVDGVETKKLIDLFIKFYDSLSVSKNVITAYQEIGIYNMISSKALSKLMLIDSKIIVASYNGVTVNCIYTPNELEKQLLEIEVEKLLKTTEYFIKWLQNTLSEHECFALLGI